MTDQHGLTEADLEPGFDGYDFPAVRMAGMANPRLLEAMLSHGWQLSPFYRFNDNGLAMRYGPNAYMNGRSDGIYDSPLLRAIESGQLENISILLRAGADPNGQLLRLMYDYSMPFARSIYQNVAIQDREFNVQTNVQLDRNAAVYTENMTRAEMEEGPARFWAGKAFPPLLSGAMNAPMTAIEMAARKGSIEALQTILTAGADHSFWLSSPPSPPLTLSHSALSISSPLHAAIEERNTEMLKELLSYGFNPNLLPLAATISCFSPLMTALACEPPNIEACEILSSLGDINMDLRSPIYRIHALHVATAQLSVSLLRYLSEKLPLDRAGKTALGHTLLHIACLPLEPSEINLSSSPITTSITRVRALSRQPLSKDPDSDRTSLSSQIDTVNYILSNSHCSVSEQDELGNTALHYLASYADLNEPLIALLRSSENDQSNSWNTSRNQWGYTAEDIYFDGKNNANVEMDRRVIESERRRARRGGLWRGRGRGTV
ncbi:MAG: hypothetical protein Q9182_001568 [Xanthomendoza sp. 2 TL-2023]